MTPGERIAFDAGFRRPDQITTANNPDKASFCGMDVVTSPLMPEGYVAFRTERGALIIPPDKPSWWLSFNILE